VRHRTPGRFAQLVTLLLALHVAASRGVAQTPQAAAPILRDFMHEKWNNEEGLTNPALQSVVRSSDGYLWVGALRGLIRFDGQRFRPLDVEAGVDGRLNTARITAIAEDGEGAMWIGTAEYGVARIRGSTVDWFGAAEGLPSADVRCLFIDRGGQVWAGTEGGLAGFRERVFIPVPGYADSVHAVAEDAAGDMWAGSSAGTLIVEHGSLVRRRATAGGVEGFVWALLRDRDGRLWAGTNVGLFVAASSQRFVQRREFGPRWVTSLAGDRAGRVWVGTSGDGLHVIEGAEPSRRLGVDEGLSQEAVTALHVDAEGSVWVATRDGLDRVRPRLLRTLASPGPASMAWSVSPDDRRGVWVGTNRGLARARPEDQQVSLVPGVTAGTVRDVLTARDGTTWAGVDESLIRLTPGRAPRQVAPPEKTLWGRVRAIFEDRDGVLWVGATLAGLMRLGPGGVFVPQPFADERDPGRVWTITQDEQGALWVGGHGLHRFANQHWTTFSRESGLPTDDVMSILPEADRVWLGGFNEGLTLLRGERVTVFRRLNAAVFPQAYAIVDDGRGYLWVSSSFGLQRLSKRELSEAADGARREFEVRSFDKLDGLISPDFNGAGAHAGARTREGLLWFANSSGVVVVDPAQVDAPPPLAPVRVESVAADDVETPVQGDVELARGRGRQRLEFQFSSPSLLTPRRVRFRYRLENFDREWVDSGTRRTATYTGLPGGRYRFRVQAYYAGTLPNAGLEAGVGVFLPRYVSETSAFLVSLPLALVAAGYGFHLLRTRRLRRQAGELTRVVDERTQALRAAQADLERRVHERTAQLEAELAERKRLESQLVQAQKLDSIGRLAGGIAHDLNNLLTAILGYASFAEHASVETIRDDVRQITAAGERAARLTQQLLAFARRQVTEPRNLNPNAVIRDLEPMLRRLIGEDIELTCTLPEPPWTVRADANQIQQVLVNLVINARDAMPEGGRLTIAATHERAATPIDDGDDTPAAGDCVVIAVADNGVGITDAVKAHLFEPFFTTKPAGKGTGLGLATSYGIVTQAGGHIDVESTVGQGTMVRVSLPRVAAPPDAADETPRAELSPTADPRTLLLAEDEELVRAMASRVLRDLGHEVLEAVDGEEALEVAARHTGSLDLLITDLVMPRMGGLDLATRLRMRHPGLRVVFMSGYADRVVAAQLPAGAPMLHKPFTPNVLAQRVHDVLRAADGVSP
jgi:signal transduction histidine kinase/ligand-binding sensor domain-containing protein/CheY-like chemotaxis protein